MSRNKGIPKPYDLERVDATTILARGSTSNKGIPKPYDLERAADGPDRGGGGR